MTAPHAILNIITFMTKKLLKYSISTKLELHFTRLDDDNNNNNNNNNKYLIVENKIINHNYKAIPHFV